ncbi:MAG: ribosome maturation factor RimM [Bacteroidia bacterium]
MQPLAPEERFLVGRVGKPHGLQGNLYLHLETENFFSYPHTHLWLARKPDTIAHPYTLQKIIRIHKKPKQLILNVKEITDRTQAETLRQGWAYFPLSYLPDLPAEDFYFFEVEGFAVEEKGKIQGYVKGYQEMPAEAALIIQKLDQRILFLPVRFVERVDKCRKILYTSTPEGLWEL